MADLLAMVMMIAGFAVLLLARGRPSLPRCAAAGVLMGASAVVRPTTLPLVIFVAVYLLATRAGWRRAVMALVAGAVPVLAYMSWFAAVSGSFNLTSSNGLFLWSRTMSFASCAVIKPPPDLIALCPDRQPGALAQPVASRRLLPKQYLCDHQTWMWTSHTAPGGIVPDTEAFTSFNNQRALRFALRAIEAQPLGYARVVAHDVSKPFKSLDIFPFRGPGIRGQHRGDRAVPRPSPRDPAGPALFAPDPCLPADCPAARPAVRADRAGRPGRDRDPAAADGGGRAAVGLRAGDGGAADRRARVYLPLRDPGRAAGLHGRSTRRGQPPQRSEERRV